MKRREFIALLGGAAVAWPQQTPMPVVGLIRSTSNTAGPMPIGCRLRWPPWFVVR